MITIYNVTCGIWEELLPWELDAILGDCPSVISVSLKGNVTFKNRETGETVRMTPYNYQKYIDYPKGDL